MRNSTVRALYLAVTHYMSATEIEPYHTHKLTHEITQVRCHSVLRGTHSPADRRDPFTVHKTQPCDTQSRTTINKTLVYAIHEGLSPTPCGRPIQVGYQNRTLRYPQSYFRNYSGTLSVRFFAYAHTRLPPRFVPGAQNITIRYTFKQNEKETVRVCDPQRSEPYSWQLPSTRRLPK